jgi:hypothetical protein
VGFVADRVALTGFCVCNYFTSKILKLLVLSVTSTVLRGMDVGSFTGFPRPTTRIDMPKGKRHKHRTQSGREVVLDRE